MVNYFMKGYVAVMGNWFGSGKRGFFLGIWSGNANVLIIKIK